MNLSRLRWALLLAIPAGLIVDPDGGSIIAAVLATIAFAILLAMLGRPLVQTLPLIVLTGLFLIGYFGKFGACRALDDATLDEFLGWPANRLVSRDDLMADAYRVIVLAFAVFCPTAALLIAAMPRRLLSVVPPNFGPEGGRDRLFAVAFGAITAILAVTAVVQHVFGLGVMGTGNVELPFRMAGVVIHSRNVLLPYLLLVLFFIASRSGSTRWAALALAILFAHGVTQSLLMASRGVLLYILMPVGFLILLARRINRKQIAAALGVFLMVAMAHDAITALRVHRIEGGRGDIAGGLRNVAKDYSLVESTGHGIAKIFFRFTGIDGLIISVSLGEIEPSIGRVGDLLFDPERTFARIFTQDFAGCHASEVHQLAPGFVGTFYALGGHVGVVLGVILWTTLVARGWVRVWDLGLRTTYCIASYYGFLVLYFSESGVFEEIPVKLGVAVAGFALGELLARRAGPVLSAPTSPSPHRETLRCVVASC
jgi:hypothetical protein